MVLRELTNEIDKNKQVTVIIPNITHSLDASHIMQIIMDLENKVYPIITVYVLEHILTTYKIWVI